MMDGHGRQSGLYRGIAKDFQPKVAIMNLCRYVEELIARIELQDVRISELEEKVSALKTPTKPAATANKPVK